MSFNSILFLLVFLPVTLLIYWMLRKREHYSASLCFLTFASFVFYGISYFRALSALVISLAVNYLFVRKILKNRKKCWCGFGVAFNILFIAFFKYGPLAAPELFEVLSAPGSSFYSFLEIALLVECYRGTITTLKTSEYCFLMMFFPKILEGPIVEPGNMLAQGFGQKSLTWEKIYRCIVLFTLGLFKKVIIADTLGKAVDYGYSNLSALHTGEALVVILSYTLQLYFDFSGYCDMATGIAGLFGFELPLNFDSPYKAENIEDFWKRWHITLTRFFTKYIYIPLGGNRKGKFRTYLNLLLVFLVSGLWHGAGFGFVIWGMMHGVLYVICRALRSGKKSTDSAVKEEKNSTNPVIRGIKVVLTFLYVNAAWVFFRAPSLKDAVSIFKSVGQLWFPRFNTGLAKCFNPDELWYVLKIIRADRLSFGIYILTALILALLLILVFFGKNAYVYANSCRINIWKTLLVSILLVWCVLSFEGVATYLYVNF